MNGKFSEVQARVYNAVLMRARPLGGGQQAGARFRNVHEAAMKSIANQLEDGHSASLG